MLKTFTFEDQECLQAEPGQFLMLWIPGVDEIPLSILVEEEKNQLSVVVKKVGEATKALHSKRKGAVIGVRGPFGNSFTQQKGKILMVSGGTGVVPILFLARRLVSTATELISIIGAKTQDELLFMNEFERIFGKEGMRVIATTEDGSYGFEGLATGPLESLLEKEEFDMIYACGPEKMMRRVFDLAEEYKIALEVSLERLMRCAIGLCGSCIVGRYRVCKDGPIFNSNQLREISSEFGISKLDFDGRRIHVDSS
jgi:dihydroorotate dehydrogenase electron transfer subunit